MAGRTTVVMSAAAAADWIEDGCVLGVGGFVTANKPMALLREVMRRRRGGLTLVAGPSSIEVDLLAALGLLKEVVTPYVGAEALAPLCPFFSRWAGRCFGVREVDLGLLTNMLRAQVYGLPFMPVKGVVGTAIPDLNPTLRPIDDPFGGPPLYAVPPQALDVAVLCAYQADAYGNVQHLGPVFLDPLLAQAARRVIVQVERLVSNEEIRRAPGETTLPCEFVDAVVVAPYGAHPMAGQNAYRVDEAHVREYARAGRAYFEGDTGPFQAYLERYIDGPAGHAGYLEAVGMATILSLGLEGGVAL